MSRAAEETSASVGAAAVVAEKATMQVERIAESFMVDSRLLQERKGVGAVDSDGQKSTTFDDGGTGRRYLL